MVGQLIALERHVGQSALMIGTVSFCLLITLDPMFDTDVKKLYEDNRLAFNSIYSPADIYHCADRGVGCGFEEAFLTLEAWPYNPTEEIWHCKIFNQR